MSIREFCQMTRHQHLISFPRVLTFPAGILNDLFSKMTVSLPAQVIISTNFYSTGCQLDAVVDSEPGMYKAR